MKNILVLMSLIAILGFACTVPFSYACAQEQENNSLVGRIAHIEGQLLRYVPDDDDWVLTEKDTPFGEYDLLFSSGEGKVEIIMPNNTLARIGADTQVQLIGLTSEATEIDVSSGTARLYNKSSSGQITVTTPFGDVIMPPGTVCDISVHEAQAEFASLKGTVEFIQPGSNTRQEVIAGSSSIIADSKQIIASAHSANSEWDGWNVDRDVQWMEQMQARGDSKKYLPQSLQDNAYELDRNGSWEQVYYEGSNRYFWRPFHMDAGWTPFSSGRWITWHGEQTWVPYDSFGYVTHHYGNWVYAQSCWYWAPPVSGVMVSAGLPLLNIGLYWYPGRVAWLSSSISIGWFPLAPYETYYSCRYWGPRSRVRYYNHYYRYNKYRYNKYRYKHYKHARFIDYPRFHNKKNYRHAGLRKGHSNEKFRGSARIPEKRKRQYAKTNKHRYESNIPGFKKTVKKTDLRRYKRENPKMRSKANPNPFKSRVVKGNENNRRTDKTIYINTPGKIVKNRTKVQKRPPLTNNKKTTRFAKATMQKQKATLNKAKQSFKQPKKIVRNQAKLQTSRQRSSGRTKQKVAAVRQPKRSRNLSAKNTNSGTRVQPQRSNNTYQAKRSNTTRKAGSSYEGFASRQNSSQNSAGRMQIYGGRGRRW